MILVKFEMEMNMKLDKTERIIWITLKKQNRVVEHCLRAY
jgi:hypothetical protein